MTRLRRVLALAATGAVGLGTYVTVGASGASAQPFNYQHLNPIQKRLVSGLLSYELGGGATAKAVSPARYFPTVAGCPQRRGGNVQVNQNCLNLADPDLQGRSQAQNETWITADPQHPSHLLASYNDYRRGDGTCGTTYSLDGGRTWQDSTVPDGFTRGDAYGSAREYWQAGGDTSVAYDTKGNAYLSCQLFNRGSSVSPNPDQSSGFFVYRSTGNSGASWNFPGRPAAQHADTIGAGNELIDKALMTVDNTVGSPYQDRVYVTYTDFAPDGTAYIYEISSADYGETFSAPVLVSQDTPLCQNTFGVPTPNGKCNENQFSQPFTAPDGSLYVVWANFNNSTANANDNHNQMLIARSTDGGRSFSTPVKVGDYYDLPDCATYQGGQDPGRACVPEKGSTMNSFFRATNYPIGAVDPKHPNRVIVTYGSYINRHSKESNGCAPAGFSQFGTNLYTGVKTGGCNNDILYSVSLDSGQHFLGGRVNPRYMPVVTTGSGQASTDQFWQGAAFTPSGKLAVTYYDRQYGSDESTGYSDITLSGTSSLLSFGQTRVTSSSMPPPTEFSGLFYGDYIAVGTAGETAYPIWSDTRPIDLFVCPSTSGAPPTVCAGSAPNAPVANDQDIYTQGLAIPTG